MGTPHFRQEGARLLLLQRPDLRDIAGLGVRAGLVALALGAALAALAPDPLHGLGALGVLLGLVGVICLGIAGLIRWIVRRVVVVDPDRGQILGRGDPLALGEVQAFRLREFTHLTEYGANRRIALEALPGPPGAPAPLGPEAVAEQLAAFAPPRPALDLVDSGDEAALRAAALAVARATRRPLLDYTAVPPQLLWGEGQEAAAQAPPTARRPGRRAGQGRPPAPGPEPVGLTVRSLRPLHVGWRGVRTTALWPFLGGFFSAPVGLGLSLHRGEADAWGLLLGGTPLALLAFAFLIRKGPAALEITADEVIYRPAGEAPVRLPRDRVVGVVRSAAGSSASCRLRLDDGHTFGQLPATPEASAWLQAAVAWALSVEEPGDTP